MRHYHTYHIKETDLFDPAVFPKVRDELEPVFKAAASFQSENKESIIISFLKHHSLQNKWIENDNQLASLFTEGSFPVTNIESLYESAQNNTAFIRSFEDYIRKHL